MDDFVHDESQEFFAEGGIESCPVRQLTKSSDLDGLAVWICWGKADGGFVFTDAFGDLEPFSEHVDEGRVDVVDAVSAISQYLIVVHLTIVSSARPEIPLVP